MQKIKNIFLFGAGMLLMVLVSFSFVFAQLEDLPNGPQNIEAVIEIIDTITNWVFAGLMAVSVIMIMLAGFQFVMEGKDPAKMTEAKNKVLFAIGGIGIALVARAVGPAVRNLLGL